ncbi:MAG: DNA methyltransferase, partial [Microcystis sp. M49637_WE12]|nr:DNA methyltransferase [Microcystis sp. M49637_WE12]
AEKVITYYSFKGDVVLDPFAGSGTVGLAAASLDRRFVLFESNFNYIEMIQKLITEGNQADLDSIIWLNCPL